MFQDKAVLAVALTASALITSCASGEDDVARQAQTRTAPERPNVVIIVADDLGWGDIGVNGSEVIATPNIDALAAGGINFTTGYVTAAVCAPSRAALMSGRHQQSFAYEYNPRGRHDIGVPVQIDTIGTRMQGEGYTTALIGKWHLGRTPEHHPQNRGFDRFYGFTGGGNGYLSDPEDGDYMSDPVEGSAPGFKRVTIESGYEVIDVDGDLTSLLTEQAVDFIEDAAAEEAPFLLVLTHFAPHSPLQATHEQLAPYAHIEDRPTRIYSAMVTAMDSGVGEVVDALERSGERENTLVVFMSDNGCAHYIGVGTCSNEPYQGYKGTYFEGGVRVPMIANWPGVLDTGVAYDQPVVSYDWTVTALTLAGAPVENEGFDGVNLMPFLANRDIAGPRSRMHWRTLPNYAIRDGDWKLWMVERTDGSGMQPLLYNLAEDPGETRNLAAENPEQLQRMIDAFEEWDAGLPEPGFESQRTASFSMPNGMRLNVYN